MDKIFEKGKEYELITINHDPQYNKIVDAIEIVKKFIIDNELIIYGGTAIDYALRLRGDKIYPDDMLSVPDLDFYSPKNVEHSYQLADLLYFAGFKEARAINALHMETMRCDVIDNHFIADISYRPPEIFDKLPYLKYNGMKIIHPDFQRIDLHSSLSFPYDGAPREVIFARWGKDIKRFNKLNKYYPIKITGETITTREMTVPTSLFKYVLNGFAAYAVIYDNFSRIMNKLEVEMPKNIVASTFNFTDSVFTIDTLDQKFEFVHFNMDKASTELSLTNIKKYEPYANMMPERIEGVTGDKNIIIYSTKYRLLSVNSVKLNESNIRIVNVQYLLKYFISMYFINKHSPKIANTYLSRYLSLLEMITVFESAVKNRSDKDELIELSLLFPSVHTYGDENIDLSRQVALNRLYHDLDDTPLYTIPQNYYPCRSVPNGKPHPEFNYSDSPFFMESGREIK